MVTRPKWDGGPVPKDPRSSIASACRLCTKGISGFELYDWSEGLVPGWSVAARYTDVGGVVMLVAAEGVAIRRGAERVAFPYETIHRVEAPKHWKMALRERYGQDGLRMLDSMTPELFETLVPPLEVKLVGASGELARFPVSGRSGQFGQHWDATEMAEHLDRMVRLVARASA